MKANAPEKLYVNFHFIETHPESHQPLVTKQGINKYDIEYIRADSFIEKALKWYCLDCECNDNCKYTKCFFYREYKRHLKGGTNALPPKFSDRILNEDGSTSDNWRYRHFIAKIQDAFIEKAYEYLSYHLDTSKIDVNYKFDFIEEFRKYMEGE